MKRKILLIVLAVVMVLCLALAACEEQCEHNYENGKCTKCGEAQPGYVPPEPPKELSTDIPQATEATLMLHYFRTNGDYNKWDFWIWLDGVDGKGFPIDYKDDYGAVALCKLSDLGATEADTLGIIPRMGGSSWTSKDCEVDRKLDLSTLELGADNYLHIYLTQGDPNLYAKADDIKYTVTAKFLSATQISVTANMAIKQIVVYEGENEFVTIDGESQKAVTYNLPADKSVDLSKSYTAKISYVDDTKEITAAVNIMALYDSEAFAQAFNYDGELGAIHSPTETVFRVWSPISSRIMLNIYNSGHEEETPASYEMTRTTKGVFEYSLSDKDYEGKYYTYTVYNPSYPDGQEIVDPYAKSAGLNGTRGMIVNFANTNPQGWEDVSPIAYDRKELVVWETHVADVTSSKTWTGTEANRKKFLGMIESGTTYTKNDVTVKTGFDHIVELGVNAVQILPFFDQANREDQMVFNWGYNPLNYNVIEGGYSSDATDGYARIREFKQLVQAFNGKEINIIMDVVYNHVNGASGSNFDVLMPGYYFRYTGSGNLSNGSGCGNETASNRPMFRKFMIDSVCFWAKEYKLGGFRFDLMGLHDIETMNLLVAALKEINPDIVVYGEPWTGGTSTLPQGSQAIKNNGSQFVGFGMFNDTMRDALIKGGLSGVKQLGWITSTASPNGADVASIENGLIGKINASVADPNKTVNYVTCHDNYTLYDRIQAAGIKDAAQTKKMAMLANSVVFSSNGTTFMLAGEEFLRTKKGSGNSYNLSYEINELNYELKVDNKDMFENYQKLIELKTSCSGLHLNQDEMEGNYTVTRLADGSALQIVVKDTKTNRVYTIIHANGSVSNLKVDLSGNTLYLDTLNVQGLQLTAQTEIAPFQTIIAYK